jgi:DNA-binding transcriptional MerR regulator
LINDRSYGALHKTDNEIVILPFNALYILFLIGRLNVMLLELNEQEIKSLISLYNRRIEELERKLDYEMSCANMYREKAKSLEEECNASMKFKNEKEISFHEKIAELKRQNQSLREKVNSVNQEKGVEENGFLNI